MTLAIGMKCIEGLILAADTRVSYDGSEVVSNAVKATSEKAGEGIYAIAHSAADVHAADSMIAEFRAALRDKPPVSLLSFIEVTKKVMTEWFAARAENSPYLQLLVGVCLPNEQALYFCEPPNTVTFIHDIYKAIGEGWSVTDPIYNAWLKANTAVSVHASLCQLSYLMNKAKQAFPRTIGGHTDVVFLETGFSEPLHIQRQFMAMAEAAAIQLDHNISHIARTITAFDSSQPNDVSNSLARVHQCALNYSRHAFATQIQGKVIKR